MDIHELYNTKKEEYQNYLIASGIYKNQLAEALTKLKTAADDLQTQLSAMDSADVPKKLPVILTILRDPQSLAEQPNAIKNCLDELQECSSELESTIERILNDNI